MSNKPEQNFANHSPHIDAIAITYLLLPLVALGLAVASIIFNPILLTIAVILIAISVVLIAVNTRGYSNTVQDRVIRLEERLRMKDVLPEDLQPRIGEFTRSQFVGLRFASDEELPDLAQKVLDEKIDKAGEIKKLVKDWKADSLRV